MYILIVNVAILKNFSFACRCKKSISPTCIFEKSSNDMSFCIVIIVDYYTFMLTKVSTKGIILKAIIYNLFFMYIWSQNGTSHNIMMYVLVVRKQLASYLLVHIQTRHCRYLQVSSAWVRSIFTEKTCPEFKVLV